jgi:beta-alanine degradation protein BauB
MKSRKGWVVAAAVLGLALYRATAQDPLAVAPDMYRLLLDNERVRVMEVTFKPGQKIASHSHPDHCMYVAEAGKLRISKPDGSSSEVELQLGQVVWVPAETHWAENIGQTTVRIVVHELKSPPAKPAETSS